MACYYARHTKIAISEEAIADLCSRGRIAVHYPEATGRPLSRYPDAESLDPGDYSGRAKATLRALVDLARDGGLVVAHYRGGDGANGQQLVVGRVPPESTIELERNRWCQGSRYPGREAWLKTLAYERLGTVPVTSQRRALAFVPRQSTLCVWHKIGDRIEKWISGSGGGSDLAELTSDEQEVLCAEFLRDPSIPGLPRLSALLMPVGRTMRDVDIVGTADDGKLLYAQVKFDHKTGYAADLSRLYGHTDAHLLLFSGIEESDLSGRVLQVSLGEVFERFRRTARGAEWLRHVLASV